MDFEEAVEELLPAETKEEEFEDLPEEAEELEGCTSALAGEEAETEPVEALDHVMANVQGNTQSAPGSEEDILLTVAALTIGVAFSDTSADIDVLYSHVAAPLQIDVSRAMQKVDARAVLARYLLTQMRSPPPRPLWPESGVRAAVEELTWPQAQKQPAFPLGLWPFDVLGHPPRSVSVIPASVFDGRDRLRQVREGLLRVLVRPRR